MPEIEFLEVHQPDEGNPAHQPRTRFDARTAIALIPAVLALAAAALAAWAPFRWIYSLTLPTGGDVFTSTSPGSGHVPATHVHADAWGRTFNTGDLGSSSHGTRFGIVSEVGAGLALMAAIAFVLGVLASDRHSGRRWLRAGRTAGLLSAGIGGAISACCYLSYLTLHDEFASIAKQEQLQGDGQAVIVELRRVQSGDSWLIAAIGALVIAVAVGASMILARDARDTADVRGPGSQHPPNLGTYPAGTDPAGDQP